MCMCVHMCVYMSISISLSTNSQYHVYHTTTTYKTNNTNNTHTSQYHLYHYHLYHYHYQQVYDKMNAYFIRHYADRKMTEKEATDTENAVRGTDDLGHSGTGPGSEGFTTRNEEIAMLGA